MTEDRTSISIVEIRHGSSKSIPSRSESQVGPPHGETELSIFRDSTWHRLGGVLRCALLGALAVGCTGPRGGTETAGYLPGWPEARAAITAALDDWRDSAPPYPPSREMNGVVFVDKQRKPGDRLRSFTILAQAESENVRQFTVRLQMHDEDVPRLVRYNVLGRQPAWVFRLEDYEMISHWEHPMNEEPSPAPPPSSETPTPPGRP